METEQLANEQKQTISRMLPLIESLFSFFNEAADSPYPLITSIYLDTLNKDNKEVLLRLWCTQKLNSPFDRISELVSNIQEHKSVLLLAMNELLLLGSENAELLLKVSKLVNTQ
jgi:hypothetical protein